jgi:hypothetical protein
MRSTFIGNFLRPSSICQNIKVVFYSLNIEVFHIKVVFYSLNIEVTFHFPNKLRLSSIYENIEVIFHLPRNVGCLLFNDPMAIHSGRIQTGHKSVLILIFIIVLVGILSHQGRTVALTWPSGWQKFTVVFMC